MSDLLLPQLIVLAVGGSIAPPLLLLTILLLGSQRSLLNATALVLGYFAVIATIGIVSSSCSLGRSALRGSPPRPVVV
jgi:hypothetical protein